MRFRHEVLQAARLELGLTQEELAQSLGVAVRTYRRYESGAVNAGGFTLRNASRQSLLDRMNAELGTSVVELVESAVEQNAAEANNAEENAAERDQAAQRLHHVLQPARHFVGRDAELAKLERFRASSGVLAIVGVGGSGKTALVERFLRSHRADLVYSLYEDRRVEPFLKATAALSAKPAPLIVLDGVEVHQVAFEDGFAHGELREPALRDWLRGVAAGHSRAQVLVTTRFPLVDFDAFRSDAFDTDTGGYDSLQLGPLKRDDIDALLGAWGVTDAAALAPMAGGHALSAAVLGSYVGGFLQGALPAEWRFEEAATDDALARRLQSVLKSYRAALPEETVAVLTRLASAPLGGSTASDVHPVHLRRLVRLGLVFALGHGRFAMHPFVRDALRARDEERATLAQVPGIARSEESDLQRVAAEIQAALDRDDIDAAIASYHHELGGFDQLGLKLGEYALGRRVLAQIEPRLEGRREVLGDRPIARLLYQQGLYSGALGDLKHAMRCYARILEHSEIDVGMFTTALRAQAYSLRLFGQPQQALALTDEALQLAAAVGERGHEGRAHALRGAILSDLSRYDEARAAFVQSEATSGPMVARRGLWRAEFELVTGETRAARERTLANIEVCAELRWPGHVAHCDAVLGFAALADGEGDAAAHLDKLKAWTERTHEAELVARADALAERLDPAFGAARAFAERRSTRELLGLTYWFNAPQ